MTDSGNKDSQPPSVTYRLWVNDARTLLFRLWSNGIAEIATRETPAHTWGPPIKMGEERT